MSEADPPNPAPATAPPKTSYAAGRGRRGPPLKFLGALRGEGVLISAAGETAVSYQVDVFQGGAGRTGSGTVDGPMLDSPDEAGGDAKLRLSDGRELPITLQGINERGAMFETRGEPPRPG